MEDKKIVAQPSLLLGSQNHQSFFISAQHQQHPQPNPHSGQHKIQ